MKKVILVLLVLVVVSGSAFAIDMLSFPPPLGGGAIMIDLGIGLRYIDWGTIVTKMQVPPLWFQAEYALPVGVPISVGGGFAFTRRVGRWDDDFSLTYITPHLRANWHWGFPVSWLDFYTGLGVGFDIVNANYGDYSVSDSDFFWGIQAGAHFYFTRVIGVMAETGFPFYLKAGVALKFGGN